MSLHDYLISIPKLLKMKKKHKIYTSYNIIIVLYFFKRLRCPGSYQPIFSFMSIHDESFKIAYFITQTALNLKF